ncbi:hypothetical protein F4604DRAFT_1902692 [Suillus subluteus]|nr:hypothetical protein F4604DRAFT_1902692 [Suillus subluteus]
MCVIFAGHNGDMDCSIPCALKVCHLPASDGDELDENNNDNHNSDVGESVGVDWNECFCGRCYFSWLKLERYVKKVRVGICWMGTSDKADRKKGCNEKEIIRVQGPGLAVTDLDQPADPQNGTSG